MSAILPNASTQVEPKQLERGLSALHSAVPRASSLAKATLNDLQGGDWVVGCAGRAIDNTMSRKAAASEMREDQAQLTNELKSVGHLSLRRLGMLDRTFWRAFLDEISAHLDLDDDAERLKKALEMRSRCDDVIDEIARKGLR